MNPIISSLITDLSVALALELQSLELSYTYARKFQGCVALFYVFSPAQRTLAIPCRSVALQGWKQRKCCCTNADVCMCGSKPLLVFKASCILMLSGEFVLTVKL